MQEGHVMPSPRRLDRRFSDPDAEPTPWAEVTDVLDLAELYWLRPSAPTGART